MQSITAKRGRTVQKKTLDSQHQTYMSNVQETTLALMDFEGALCRAEEEIKRYETLRREQDGLSEADMDAMLSKLDERIDLQSRISKLRRQHDEVSYLTNTADILFKYYDLVENGGSTGQNMVPTPASAQTQNSILRWFGAPQTPVPTAAQTPTCGHETPKSKKHMSSSNQSPVNTRTKTNLLDQYLSCTDDLYIRDIPQDEDCCNYCNSKNISVCLNDGHIMCNKCHSIEYIIVDHEKPSYREPPREITCFAYKRINHLNEWINQIQGKETTDIPDEIYDRIMLEIKKQRIANMAALTQNKIREILKTLGLHKYYEHTPHILNRLNGQPMPHLSPELEEKLRNMFKQVQVPYVKHMPKARKNFLSYSYCLHKFLQLLEKDELLIHFPLLLSTSGARVQESMPALVACAA